MKRKNIIRAVLEVGRQCVFSWKYVFVLQKLGRKKENFKWSKILTLTNFWAIMCSCPPYSGSSAFLSRKFVRAHPTQAPLPSFHENLFVPTLLRLLCLPLARRKKRIIVSKKGGIHNTVAKGYGEICIHKGLYAHIYIYAHCSLCSVHCTLYSYII